MRKVFFLLFILGFSSLAVAQQKPELPKLPLTTVGRFQVIALQDRQADAILLDTVTGATYRSSICPDSPDLYDKSKPVPNMSEHATDSFWIFHNTCWFPMRMITPTK